MDPSCACDPVRPCRRYAISSRVRHRGAPDGSRQTRLPTGAPQCQNLRSRRTRAITCPTWRDPMTKSAASAEALLPVELGAGKVKFAQGVKAGRWVFATGLMAQDFVNGIAPDVLAERAPHAGLPKREKEALRIFENLDAVLRAAGTDRRNLVRTDQYYTTVAAVPPYQHVRREFLSGRIPPSTSIAQQGLLLPGADMNIQAMAVIPEKGFEMEHLKHEQLKGRATSGYSPALTVGDFIFIPGITSLAVGDEPRRNGVAAAALMAEGANGAASRSSSRPSSSSPSGWPPRSPWPARASMTSCTHRSISPTARIIRPSTRRGRGISARPAPACRSFPAARTGSRPMTARSRST